MSRTPRPGPAESPPTQSVRILAVPPSPPNTVRFLGPYHGIPTHYWRGNTVYCPGKDLCPSDRHKLRLIWKSYAPVEEWIEDARSWRPRVLEITEALEELLEGRKLRGEVWLLSRLDPKNPTSEVTGVKLHSIPLDTLPGTFAILPQLRRFYRAPELDFKQANPLPKKLKLPDSPGEPPVYPPEFLPEPPAHEDPAQRAKLAKQMAEFRESRKRWRQPTEPENRPAANGAPSSDQQADRPKGQNGH